MSHKNKRRDGIADFRSKLLALLPIASGAGIFVLLNVKDEGREYLPAVGFFGSLVTVGLPVKWFLISQRLGG